jgi:DegV family protein with EDD domain
MSVVLDGKAYLDGVELSPGGFYRLLKQTSSPPKTSAPPPARFLEAYRQAAEAADAVLCITVSSRFSACHDAARVACDDARRELEGLSIKVVDSGSAAAGEALVALAALRAASQAKSLALVETAAREVIPKVRLLAYLDTLYYLWKGGRVPGIAYAGVSLLDLKPLFEMAQGEVKNLARPRTARRAMYRLVELMRDRVGLNRIYVGVMHAGATDAAEELRRVVAEEFDCAQLFVTEFSPVMGAHTGPGLLGLAFHTA